FLVSHRCSTYSLISNSSYLVRKRLSLSKRSKIYKVYNRLFHRNLQCRKVF
ncbi:unnamed protein product, partial [Rotaria sordida]